MPNLICGECEIEFFSEDSDDTICSSCGEAAMLFPAEEHESIACDSCNCCGKDYDYFDELGCENCDERVWD